MKKILILVILLGVISAGLILTAQATSDPQSKPIEVASAGYAALNFSEAAKIKLDSNYLLYVPKAYLAEENKNDKWPMIVMLHGSGERGCSPRLLGKFGPFVAAYKQPDFPFIVLGPVCPKNHWWSDANVTLSVMALIDNIASQYNVDKDRIYLTGLSMGGFGTWNYATQYPDKFAAIAPVCGGGNPYRARRLLHLPVMIFHGKNDNKVPFWQAQQMAVTLSKMGGDVSFMVYPNTGHYIWQQVYSNDKLYSWFLKHSRSKNMDKKRSTSSIKNTDDNSML